MSEEEVRQIIREELGQLIKSDRFTIYKTMQFLDERNIELPSVTGTKIGTNATQRLGFYGVAPVVQQTHVANPSGQTADLDNEARTAITNILSRLENLGLFADS